MLLLSLFHSKNLISVLTIHRAVFVRDWALCHWNLSPLKCAFDFLTHTMLSIDSLPRLWWKTFQQQLWKYFIHKEVCLLRLCSVIYKEQCKIQQSRQCSSKIWMVLGSSKRVLLATINICCPQSRSSLKLFPEWLLCTMFCSCIFPTRLNRQCLYCSNKSYSRKERECRQTDLDAGLMISTDLFLP